jgi:hypothetical protein
MPVGTTSDELAQYAPGVHGSAADMPAAGANEPAGDAAHALRPPAANEPAAHVPMSTPPPGQKRPAGHAPLPVADDAPPAHQKPAVHWPV